MNEENLHSGGKNDPELPENTGAEASAAFENMARMDAAELEKYREHLLRYCELDTLALVKIWEKLTDAAAGR